MVVIEPLHPIHPRLKLILDLAGVVVVATEAGGRFAYRTYRARKRRGSYRTLRPGTATPMWNELARAVASYTTHRGGKNQLARFLGVPRQRIHQYIVARSSLPDAEKVLRLMAWLAAQETFTKRRSPKSRNM